MLNDLNRKLAALLCVAVSLSMFCSCTGSSTPVPDSVYTQESDEDAHTPISTEESAEERWEDIDNVTADAITQQAQTAETELFCTVETELPESEIPPAAASQPQVFYAQELSKFSVGRTLLTEDALYMNHTCSGIRFAFYGTSLKAELVSGSEYCSDGLHKAWVAVYLDDSTVPYKRFSLDSERAEYQLFESEQPVETRITIVKLTEQQFGTAGISRLEAGAADILSVVPASEGFIEFFGDSITAGYGNEGELSHGFDTAEENGYLTYAPIAARELNVDYSMVCVSGMGLTASRTCDYVAADIYPKTDVFLSDEDHSFSRKPQLIVVNLGANDSYYINKDESYYEQFESRYYELLTQIRSKNPDAVILCCICDYWQARMPQIERVIERFSADTGDSRIHSLLLPYVTNDEDYGSDAHPKISVQYEIAEVLVEKIRELGIF